MRILIATGGSSHSEIALRMAATLAAATEAHVTLLTVAVSDSRRSYAETIAVQSAAALREMAGEVETLVVVGRAADRIIHEVQRGGYDLLVIGERPGHRLIHRILANTVGRLMDEVPCPVLIARDAGLPLRMLICESGRHPLVAERMAEKLCPLLDLCRQATLLHVMSQIAAAPGVAGRDLRMDAVTHIRRGTQEGALLETGGHALNEFDIAFRPLLRHGRVVDEVIDEAHEQHYDLVVIGAFRATGWDRLMLSDQAHVILNGTSQPLLVV